MDCYQMQNITVDFDKVLCPDFLGLNAIYHGFAWMPENLLRGMTDADREREFDTVMEARLRIARTMFYPGDNCEKIEGPYDMHCPRMEAIRKWCQAMKDRGVTVALQTGWHYSRNTYFGHDAPNSEVDPQRFAKWAAESFSYLMNDCGLDNIRYAFLFTEPTSYASGDTPEGYTLWTYYVKICKAIDQSFREYGLRERLKFVGPNNTSGGTHLAEAVRDLNDVVDIYSSHDYNFAHQGQWANMAQNMADIVAPTGKPFWMDEYGMQLEVFRRTPEYGNYIGQVITASMAAGHQTTMIWTLVDQLHCSSEPMGLPEGAVDDGSHSYNRDSFHNGIHRWGLVSSPLDTVENAGSPYPSWYAYLLISKALGGRLDGGKVASVYTESAMTLYAAAVKQDEEYTVMVVNSNAEETKFTLDLGKIFDRPIYRHVFDPYSAAPCYGTQAAPIKVPCEGKVLTDILPMSAVAIYTTREVL